jgi:hypothetical protein
MGVLPGYLLQELMFIYDQSACQDVRIHRTQFPLALLLHCRDTGEMDFVSGCEIGSALFLTMVILLFSLITNIPFLPVSLSPPTLW